MKVYVCTLMIPCLESMAVSTLQDAYMINGALRYNPIHVPYKRTDLARSDAAREFVEQSDDPNDVLVMLDCDHAHPMDVVKRLVAWDVSVVGALAFRRSPPYDPQFYKLIDGKLRNPIEWESGLLEVDAVGMGAVAIKRRVFTQLDTAGFHYPWFRYAYNENADGAVQCPSEDIFFCITCKHEGIPMFVDTTFETPHLTQSLVSSATWKAYLAEHPELIDDMIGG